MEKMGDADSLDLEKVTGSTPTNVGNNSLNNEYSNDHAIHAYDLTQKRAVQCLLKDDKVFSLNCMDEGGWSAFIGGSWSRKNCKFVTGNVIMNKDWCESKLSLQVRWENGNIEKLNQKSTDVAFGDRIFVLDRQCVSPGSRVFLVDHPDLEGTVTAKRYLATGTATSGEIPDLVFEDIDADKLRRETHGNGYKDNKILYRGWLGITCGYRTRVYLQSLNEETSFFSVVVDGNVSQSFNIGDEINLGFKILRGAIFGAETTLSSWLINFFKFYNTQATVIDCQIDQLNVCWIGKASNPNAAPNQCDLPNAPGDLIPYEELPHVYYLFGDTHNQMTTKSLWVHECSNNASRPVSKDKWCRKWLKIMDWDRWEFPVYEDDSSSQLNELKGHKCLTLEIMYTRSVVHVLWSNGVTSILNAGDVIPVQTGSVWSEMTRFHIGSIVQDRMSTSKIEKYGIIMNLSDHNCATVKWVMRNGYFATTNEENVIIETSFLYNLMEKSEYSFISKADQRPLVSCGEDQNIGVVLGISPEDQKVRVRMIDQSVEHFWPHEIIHYKCDVLLCPIDNRWTLWYEHLAPPSGITQVCPETDSSEKVYEKHSGVSLNFGLSSPKKKFECIKYVPRDNIFICEDVMLPTRETAFHQALEQEINEMEKDLPDGMWVEYYIERGDIFSAIVTGPKGSMFEDFLFIFDFFLMEDFPKSEPHINFRSMGMTLIPGHFCKSGAVFLPEETRLTDDDFSSSSILNLLLEIKDFMGIPLELIHEKKSMDTVGIKPESSEELKKFVALAALDYVIALLQNPPKNWRSVIYSHFAMALPRIIGRFKKGGIEVKRPHVLVNNEKGDSTKSEEYEMVTVPWNDNFLNSVCLRITELEKIYSSMEV